MATRTLFVPIFRNVRKVSKRDYWFRHVCPCVCLAVSMAQLFSHWTDFYKILFVFFENLWKKFKSIKIWQQINSTLLENQYTFIIISRSIILRWKIFQEKFVQKIKTHTLCSFFFFCLSCRLWDMWKTLVEPNRPRMKICPIRIACWITMATNTHQEYVILIYFSPVAMVTQRASLLRYTYIASLFLFMT
jgi:hypothetical protein